MADKAVSGGIEFARETQARVTLFTAVPEYRMPSEAQLLAHGVESIVDHTRRSRQLAGEILAGAELRAKAAGLDVATDYACSNQPWQAIIDAARRNGCDAIFMGSHGRKGLAGLWHGSETREVLRHSDIPTLVYR